jgi:hypothetical protein
MNTIGMHKVGFHARWGALALMLNAAIPVAAQYWERTYGGFDSDQARDAIELEDGGFFVVGSTGSFGEGGDIYLLRLDQAGAREWSTTYGGFGVEQGFGLARSQDEFLLVGLTNSFGAGAYDVFAVNINGQGEVVWQRTFGTEDWDIGRAVAAIPGGEGWVIAGNTYGRGAGDSDAWVLRLDATGDTLWTRTLGGVFADEARSVIGTADGSCIVSGAMGTAEGSRAFMARLLVDGTTDWLVEVQSDSTEAIHGSAVLSNSDIVFVGYTHANAPERRMLVIRTTADGAVVWRESYGQIADFEAFSVVERSNGGIAVVGYNEAFGLGGKDTYVLLIDPQGNFQQGLTFGSSEDETGYSIISTSDGGLLFCGTTDGYGPGIEATHIIRTDVNASTQGAPVITQLDPLSVNTVSVRAAIAVHPNPVSQDAELFVPDMGRMRITWRLRDLAGRLLTAGELLPGERSILMPNAVSGLYLLEFLDPSSGIQGVARVVLGGR